MKKVLASMLTALALVGVLAQSVFAADYTTEIDALGTSLLAEITTNGPSIVGAGLVVFGALAGIGILFKALRKSPAKG